MYLAGAFCGGAAMLVAYLSNWEAAFVGLLVGVAMLPAVALLERAPYEKQVRKQAA